MEKNGEDIMRTVSCESTKFKDPVLDRSYRRARTTASEITYNTNKTLTKFDTANRKKK